MGLSDEELRLHRLDLLERELKAKRNEAQKVFNRYHLLYQQVRALQ